MAMAHLALLRHTEEQSGVIRNWGLVHVKLLYPDRLGYKRIISQTRDFAIKDRAGIRDGVLGNQIAIARRFHQLDTARVWHHIEIAYEDFFLGWHGGHRSHNVAGLLEPLRYIAFAARMPEAMHIPDDVRGLLVPNDRHLDGAT